MLRTYRQFILWHPELQRVGPFTNSETIDGLWLQIATAGRTTVEAARRNFESQGWVVVEAIISVQGED